MIDVNVYPKFISHEKCDYILKHALKTFEIDSRTYHGWYARTNINLKFENEVKVLLRDISPFNKFNISWINLTEYENNRSLDLHKDGRSDFTFTIPLTDDYEGGDFLIENDIYKLNKGDCICFNGNQLKHGVSKVTSGHRAALNIWTKPIANSII